jgi:hypothetical protein
MRGNEAYFPVPTIRREVKVRPPKGNGSAEADGIGLVISVVVLMRSPVGSVHLFKVA